MRRPAYLENLRVPPARIAVADLVRKVAWHETGHAVSWALNGGTLAQTTIMPGGDEGGILWGLTTYDIPDEPSTEERRRRALAGMGAAAICELARIPDIEAIGEDLQSSIDDLRTIYSNQVELLQEANRTWIGVLKFFGTSSVWRTAVAFVRR